MRCQNGIPRFILQHVCPDVRLKVIPADHVDEFVSGFTPGDFFHFISSPEDVRKES
jgi:hypothetical protein